MPTTPLRGWTYPAEGQNPYFATIEGLFLAQDTDVNTLATGTRSVATGGTGRATLTSGSYLKGAGTTQVSLQAAPIPVADGGTGRTSAVLVGTLIADSAAISNTTTRTALNKTITIPANTLTAGAVVRVEFRVLVGSKATAAGSLELDVFVGGTRLGYIPHVLVDNTAGQEFGGFGAMVVRTAGSGGTVMAGPSGAGNSSAAAPYVRQGTAFSGSAQALNTTVTNDVMLYVTFSVADVANTVVLQNLMVWVEYPGSTVS